jgi:drug/metabolite transporter (DMT)-like permease
VASAFVHILYFIFLAGAYRWGELSYTYPIMRGGGPMIVALVGALALGEVLPGRESAGVVLICAGILAFASGRHDRRATLFALANALVIAAYTLIDAQGARLSGAPVSYTLWFFAANGALIFAMGVLKRGRAVPDYLRRHWARAALGGACSLGAYGIALWAMTRAPVALVAVLRETSVIFGAVLGALVLGEKMTRRRLLATGAVLAGLIVLRL